MATTPTTDVRDDRIPQLSAMYFLRLASACVAGFVALKVGSRYMHLCSSGSRSIEVFAFLGVPVVCLGILCMTKRLWLAITLAVLLILISKLLCRPYLDFVHGPNSPWPGVFVQSNNGHLVRRHMNPIGLGFIAAGLFAAIAGVGNWDWFMNHPKARFMCSVFGRSGARIFYVVIGIAFIVLGALFAAGVIQDSK